MTTRYFMPSFTENPRPTIHDVAAALGMHKSTVSQGLSGKGTVSAATRERILKVAREMGYEPNPLAQRLANKGNSKLVYLCSCNLDVGLGTDKILSIQGKLRRLGLEVPIYSVAKVGDEMQRTQADEVRDLCRQQPRAIIYSAQGCPASVLPELRRYQENGGIVVCYDTPVALVCDQVVFDREHNAYQAARYLIERGHRKLGLNISSKVSGEDVDLAPWANPRLRGFHRALEESGLDSNDQWYFDSGAYEQGGAAMAARFLSLQDRPTGLCIVNDYAALAFMSELIAAGVKVPQDVSIVGLDNQLVARYCPVPLTSAVHPTDEIVQAVVGLLDARLNGDSHEARTVTIQGKMVERQSVATPAG